VINDVRMSEKMDILIQEFNEVKPLLAKLNRFEQLIIDIHHEIVMMKGELKPHTLLKLKDAWAEIRREQNT